ncbi:MAG: hypothetical protein H7A46_17010 [Verrucomicrobiales bacterium]|nr:hypothetical protein [Verrucomicrobiales bacterium]
MMDSVRLNEKALPFMLKRARDLGLTLQGEEVRSQKDLWRIRVVSGHPDNVGDFFAGRRPISKTRAAAICDKLALTPEEWQEITEATVEAEPEVVRGFLRRLVVNGLESAVAFPPRREEEGEDLTDFCVPARVMTREEWSTVLGESARWLENLPETLEGLLARRSMGVRLNGWLRRAHRRVVLKGEPGEGKTTAMWLYVADSCQTILDRLRRGGGKGGNGNWRLPLLLPLSRVSRAVAATDWLTDFAVEYLLEMAPLTTAEVPAVEGWLQGIVSQRKFVLLLDALDEMPPDAYPWLRKQLADLPDIPTVLSTRYHADAQAVLAWYEELRMVPLRWWMMEDYVTRYFTGDRRGAGKANRLRRILRQNPRLRQLGQNPFFLGALCQLSAQEEGPALPSSRSGILHSTLSSLLERGDAKRGLAGPRSLRNEAKMDILAKLAWRFQEKSARPLRRVELLREIGEARVESQELFPLTAEALLEEFLQDGILVRRGKGLYDFLLRRFREYALARHLAIQAERGSESPATLMRQWRSRADGWGRKDDWSDFRPLNQPGWWEIWPLVAGVPPGNATMVSTLISEWESAEDLLSSRLRLAASAMGEFLETRRGQGLGTQDWMPMAKRVALEVMELVRGDPAVPGLAHSWRMVLAQLPTELVVPLVSTVVRSGGAMIGGVESYLLALGEIGTAAAREHLLMIIEDGDAAEWLRAESAVGLGLIGDEVSRNAILLWLSRTKDAPGSLHYGCMTGAAYVADMKCRRELVRLLRESTSLDARERCLEECEKLFGPEIENELVEIVEQFAKKHEGPGGQVEAVDYTMEKCLGALGRVGSPESARRLLKLLKKPLSHVKKRQICLAVAETGDEESRAVLRQLHQKPDTDPVLAYHALTALVLVGEEEMVNSWFDVGRDMARDPKARCDAIAVCRECRSRLALEFLFERMFQDSEWEVQVSAAMALTGHDAGVVATRLRGTNWRELPKKARFYCASILATGGDREAADTLIEELEDEFPHESDRIVAARGLARLDDQAARECLRRIATKKWEQASVRSFCLDALRDIQQQQGWRPLQGGGWDRP